MMTKIGLTGGIGSGKSVVATLLETYDIPVYVADAESKHILVTSKIVQEKLISLLGVDIYNTQGGLNRQLMADLIFNDEHLLKKVNEIIHPEVYNDYLYWLNKQSTYCTVLESAILFESGFNNQMDMIIVVDAPLEQRINRVQLRDGVSREQVMQRILHQIPEEEKKEHADFVIINDDKNPLIPQIESIITMLKES